MEEMDGVEMMSETYGIDPVAETYGMESRAENSPIVLKALKCIDEVYPDGNTLNEGYFPTDAFIDEMVRWVIDIVPSHELTNRVALSLQNPSIEGDVGYGMLPNLFDGRIVYFKANGWKRAATNVITEDDPRYIQQGNKVLRGNASRPVVALVNAFRGYIGRGVEWYSATDVSYLGQYVPYSIDFIPENLEDLAAWKLAEIVLMSMSDAQAAAVCTAKVNEHLEMLAL